MAKQLSINLQPILEKEAKTLISSYRRLLTKKQGIQIDTAPRNAPSTIGIKGKDHWLVDTGETRRKGFKYRATKDTMLVFASGERHSGRRTYYGVPGGHKGKKRGVRRARTQKRIVRAKNPPTYRQIFSWHNKGLSKGGSMYSGIFQKWPVGSKAIERIGNETLKQIRQSVIDRLQERLGNI